MPLLVEKRVSPPLETNTYILVEEESRQALIIDPSQLGSELMNLCIEKKWEVAGIYLTHGHIDHSHDTALVAQETGAPVYGHKETAALLQDPMLSGALWLGMELKPCQTDEILEDGDTFQLGDETLSVLHCPGHSAGCLCLLGKGACFSGDVLFQGSVGRSDLPGGNSQTLSASLKKLTDHLAPDTRIYPGHGPATTLAAELESNPFL